MSKKTAVLTINYNQSRYTVACINSILSSDYLDFKIYCLDNGSEYSDYKTIEDKFKTIENINIIRLNKNIGYVNGINHLLNYISKIEAINYIIIMNNDTLLDSNAITELVNKSQSYAKSIITGKVYHYDIKDKLQDIGQYCRDADSLDYPPIITEDNCYDVGQFDFDEERGMIDDILWIMPKEILADVGYYSKYFYLYGEQNDYCLRAIKKGYKLRYTPNAKIWHKGSITTAKGVTRSARVIYWTTTGTLKLSELHLSRFNGVKFRIKWIIANIIKYFIKIFTGQSSLKIFIALIFGIVSFYHWKIYKYNDNGFNPF